MEEWIGKLWHRWITDAAGSHHPEAEVRLNSVARPLAVYFRALGGAPGCRISSATEDRHGARRHWLARLAGSDERVARARLDADCLRLPAAIATFPDQALNRDLYYWLAALAASLTTLPASATQASEFWRCQLASQQALQLWPGLAQRYRRLLTAYLPLRPSPDRLPPPEEVRERAIRQALLDPGSVLVMPDVPAGTPAAVPVLLWLTAQAVQDAGSCATAAEHAALEAGESRDGGEGAHRAERVSVAGERNGVLMFFRAESLLSVAEFLRINRSVDDDPDPQATEVAQDLDQLALSDVAPGERVASRVRFDLDLPSAAEDDTPLGAGILLPEWDYRSGTLHPDHVRVQDMAPRQAAPQPLPVGLKRTALRLRQQFAALQPGRRWLRAQPDGSELDLDALVQAYADRRCGQSPGEALYRNLVRRDRDLACLVLADLSLSTDAWVSSEARVIDVIRDAMLLFGEALGTTGDALALCGFSSLKRQQVRFHQLKGFDEPFSDQVRGRVMAIRPGYYTRLGAAIRRAGQLLATQPVARRVLLILSDGKPNDLDLYDSRYGIEDTRMAVRELRHQGMTPFCLTIDREGQAYLPHLFGPQGYAILRRPEELPWRLPACYAQLTRDY